MVTGTLLRSIELFWQRSHNAYTPTIQSEYYGIVKKSSRSTIPLPCAKRNDPTTSLSSFDSRLSLPVIGRNRSRNDSLASRCIDSQRYGEARVQWRVFRGVLRSLKKGSDEFSTAVIKSDRLRKDRQCATSIREFEHDSVVDGVVSFADASMLPISHVHLPSHVLSIDVKDCTKCVFLLECKYPSRLSTILFPCTQKKPALTT